MPNDRPLAQRTLTELRQLAREQGLRGYSRMSKAELLAALADAPTEPSLGTVAGAPEIPAVESTGPPTVAVRRPFGARVLQFTGAVGVVISLAALLLLPLAAVQASRSLPGRFEAGARQARALADVLQIAIDGVDNAATTLESSALALRAMRANLQNTGPILSSVGEVLADEAPRTIEATRSALNAAQAGAAAIDQVLRTLAALGPLTGVQYDPDQPLDAGLAQAAEGLRPLPASLRAIGGELERANEDLDQLSGRMIQVADGIGGMATELQSLQDSLEAQRLSLLELADRLDRIAASSPLWIAGAALLLGLAILWVASGQYAVYLIGAQQLQGADGTSEPVESEQETPT